MALSRIGRDLRLCRPLRLYIQTKTRPTVLGVSWAPMMHKQSYSTAFILRSGHKWWYSKTVNAYAQLFGFLAGFAMVGLNLGLGFIEVHADAPTESPNDRKFRLSEVKQHGRNAERFWVTHGTRVYDITEWVPNHPGGEVILRAAGGNIDAYWKIFTIHQKQDVYDILEQYFIGVVDERDLVNGSIDADEIDDPFKSDPKRNPSLHVHSERPFNAETPSEELNTFITPNDKFYVRQHLWVPSVEEGKHRLTIEMPDGEEIMYSIEDLRKKFKEYTITATMQCSGNRRRQMTDNARTATGLQWGIGAISNAEWTGVRLRDVLKDAGLAVDEPPEEVKHAQFMGSEAYGASIPIEKALDKYGDVLLVYKMNGETLPRDHGYPLRVLVPGHVAARSVKWINKIVLSEDESSSQWQQRDYKCFGPNQGSDVDWSIAPAIQETPVQSAITRIKEISAHKPEDSKLLRIYGMEEDSVVVEGYAFSGGGRKIVRVDVSTDDGRSWRQAELLNHDAQKGQKAWSWTNWRLVVPIGFVGQAFVVKAVDDAYNTQPEQYEPFWNFRGNLTNSWQRVERIPSPK